jgi:hypothetical protein
MFQINARVASGLTIFMSATSSIDFWVVFFTGDHQIEIIYFGQPIPGSPFVAKVWDPTKVIVSPIPSGCVGIPSTFCSKYQASAVFLPVSSTLRLTVQQKNILVTGYITNDQVTLLFATTMILESLLVH